MSIYINNELVVMMGDKNRACQELMKIMNEYKYDVTITLYEDGQLILKGFAKVQNSG